MTAFRKNALKSGLRLARLMDRHIEIINMPKSTQGHKNKCSVSSMEVLLPAPYEIIADRPTIRQTDRAGHREVTLPTRRLMDWQLAPFNYLY